MKTITIILITLPIIFGIGIVVLVLYRIKLEKYVKSLYLIQFNLDLSIPTIKLILELLKGFREELIKDPMTWAIYGLSIATGLLIVALTIIYILTHII